MRLPRPRLPRRTARLRLAVLCGGVFVLGGVAVPAITFLLVSTMTNLGREPGNGAFPGTKPDPTGIAAHQLKDLKLHRTAQIPAFHIEQQLLIWSGIALAIVIVAAVVPGWLIAGRVLRPLTTITTAARRISASSLHERLALPGPDDELKDLGDTLDDLFARLEASFDAQRRFVANASHELRTPLTRERALLQVTRANPARTLDTWQAVSAELLASNAEQEHLIEALLTLASSEGGPGHREPVDLAPLASACLTVAGLDAGRLGLQVRADVRPADLDGDPLLIRRLVSNLIDNAVRHNVPGGHIQVATVTSRGRAVVSVTNSGQIIPPAEVDRLFQPFQRLGTRRAHGDGHGLGLSIVRSIAAAHGAEITAQPAPGGGLSIAVSFPAAPPPRADPPRAGQTAERSAALCPQQPHDGHRGRLPGYRSQLSHVAGVLGDPAGASALPSWDRRQAGPVSGCGPAAAWIPHCGSTVVTEAGIRFPWLRNRIASARWNGTWPHAADEAARACPGRPGRAQACAGGW
jgi:signal transduction histidine kinase